MPKIATALSLILFSLVATASVQAWPLRPEEDYITLQTKHFHVTYPQEHRFAALKAAVIAEEVFPILCKRLKWTPHTPIDIVITDRLDEANGWNSVAPTQLMHLYLASPYPDDRLDYYDDWYRMLITHEMTHAIHIDAVRALPAVGRAVFGRTTPVGHLQPISVIEGMAVHEETALTTRGRARSPVSMMLLRMAALEDRWPTIDRISSHSTEWPGSAGPYIWGGVFFHYLGERYGEAALAYYNRKHSGQIWPYLFNYNAKKIFGKSLKDLYKEWGAELKKQFERQRAQLAAEGLTQARQLTNEGYTHARPIWISSHELLFEERTGFRSPQIRRLDIHSKKRNPSRKVLNTQSTRGVAAAADGTVYFADIEPWDHFHGVYDLWRYRPGAWKPKRLTILERANGPALTPDGKRLIFITQNGGRTRLSAMNLATEKVTHLTDFGDYADFIHIAGPTVHPSGKWLALSIWHDDGNRDIFAFDLESREFNRLTAEAERDIDPAFGPEGRYLYFSSARSGIHNIYALDLETDELYQVTNVLGGAFMPAVDPTGERLAFIGYNAGGYDVYLMPLDRASWKKVAREEIDPDGIVMGYITQQTRLRAMALNPETGEYQFWRTLWPHWWLPNFAIGTEHLSLGIQTGGRDALQYHQWSLVTLYSFHRDFLSAAGAYTYSGLTPILSFNASHRSENHGKIVVDEDGDPTAYWERRVAGNANMLWPFFARHFLVLGYNGEWRSDLEDLPPNNEELPYTGYWSGLRVGWLYGSARSYLESVNSVGGAQFNVMTTFYDPAIGSDVQQQIVAGNFAQHFPLPLRNHAFSVFLNGGASFGDLLRQRTFRLGGFRSTSVLDSGTANDRFALRGYDRGFVRGDAAATGSLEWSFPLVRINRGISTWPVFLRMIAAAPFYDAGFAVDADEYLQTEDFYDSVGTEIYIDTSLSYYYSVRFRTGVAYGLRDVDDTGGFHWLITLGGLL